VLCLTNDVIWWIPFALYLRDAPLPWHEMKGAADGRRVR